MTTDAALPDKPYRGSTDYWARQRSTLAMIGMARLRRTVNVPGPVGARACPVTRANLSWRGWAFCNW